MIRYSARRENRLSRVVRLAARRRGLTRPELAELLDLTLSGAHRAVAVLVEQGVLYDSGEHRLRREVFEAPRGRGARVYRTRWLACPLCHEVLTRREWLPHPCRDALKARRLQQRGVPLARLRRICRPR